MEQVKKRVIQTVGTEIEMVFQKRACELKESGGVVMEREEDKDGDRAEDIFRQSCSNKDGRRGDGEIEKATAVEVEHWEGVS